MKNQSRNLITRPWVYTAAAALVVVSVLLVVGLTRGPEEPIEDPAVDLEDEYGRELLTILESVKEYGSLNTLSELLEAADLDDELNGEGPFALFAPDDSAFAQLQPKQLERLMSDQKYLRAVLTRHVVTGHRVEFGDEPQTMTIKCLNGDVISAEITGEAVRVEQAWVIDEQIECSNGVIHVIDAVLLPSRGQRKD